MGLFGIGGAAMERGLRDGFDWRGVSGVVCGGCEGKWVRSVLGARRWAGGLRRWVRLAQGKWRGLWGLRGEMGSFGIRAHGDRETRRWRVRAAVSGLIRENCMGKSVLLGLACLRRVRSLPDSRYSTGERRRGRGPMLSGGKRGSCFGAKLGNGLGPMGLAGPIGGQERQAARFAPGCGVGDEVIGSGLAAGMGEPQQRSRRAALRLRASAANSVVRWTKPGSRALPIRRSPGPSIGRTPGGGDQWRGGFRFGLRSG